MHFFSSSPRIRVLAVLAGFSLLPGLASAEPDCNATVRANVEVGSGEFSLADLLTEDACPPLLRAAALVHLGRAPFAGSVRVFDGDEIRSLLRQTVTGDDHGTKGSIGMPGREPIPARIPQRVTVRRAGARASCAEISRGMFAPAGPVSQSSGSSGSVSPSQSVFQEMLSGTIACGGTARIAQGTPLEFIRTVWDAALESWEISVRCVHPTDCVPFLVRVPGRDSLAEMASSRRRPSSIAATDRTAGKPLGAELVRPGQNVSLLWDQDGIRVLVPAVCLDRGGEGAQVRARIGRGGRTVPAIVVGAGELRSAS
ncbi:MAG TPA: flagella basal body P-ring formation protein FlgA [Candidatus Sulfotelmatobacter sp.]|jgi:hypothetical protein